MEKWRIKFAKSLKKNEDHEFYVMLEMFKDFFMTYLMLFTPGK